MTSRRIFRTPIDRFALRGSRGLVALGAVAVFAFVLGAVMFGSSDQRAVKTEDPHADHAVDRPPESTMWTCSMHPQIKLPKSGKCPICFMDLIPLESRAGDGLAPRQLRMSQAARQLARLQTTPATRAYAEAEVRMVGRIAYDETKLAYITAWVPGRLDRLFADYTGITVKKGDHLVQMYSPELLAAQEELIQAHTAVSALDNTASPVLRYTAKATLEATREKLRLFGLTPRQIERIQATHEASDHLTIYAPVGGVVVQKEAREGMYVTTGTRIYGIADLTTLWVMLEAYESDLPWLRYGQRVEFTSQSFPGETFEAIVSFIDPLVDPKTRTVKVRAIVDNKSKKLKPDMFVRGVVKSRIDGHGNIVDDYLANKWISPMHPEVVKDGPGKCDVCGMDLVPATSLGYVGKAIDINKAPILIPASAPLITGKRAVVYVEIPNDDGPLFEGREIELGPRAGDFYVVKSGIEEGELVVSSGAFKIDSELQIQAKPSMMSSEANAAGIGHRHDRDETTSVSPNGGELGRGRLNESDEARKTLTPVYDSYFAVQMALAKDDLEKAKSAARRLLTATKDVNASTFSRAGKEQWTKSSEQLTKWAKKTSNAEGIETARDAFFYLSKATIKLHESVGHAGQLNYYLTYCPMAPYDNGAYWLQTVDVVWNSFYGKTMLRCGAIKKTLKPAVEGTR
ncbi:MAG: efflux RND transporter periplasmic adaptor subunit [Candidatus Latescibacterota bacterium]|nr:MAG: efflux RND transporter periplasmic adaptor subunit [Candidatus Latescibacterota bacterium]